MQARLNVGLEELYYAGDPLAEFLDNLRVALGVRAEALEYGGVVERAVMDWTFAMHVVGIEQGRWTRAFKSAIDHLTELSVSSLDPSIAQAWLAISTALARAEQEGPSFIVLETPRNTGYGDLPPSLLREAVVLGNELKSSGHPLAARLVAGLRRTKRDPTTQVTLVAAQGPGENLLAEVDELVRAIRRNATSGAYERATSALWGAIANDLWRWRREVFGASASK